jgi:RNA polymerase sigma-70 factor (ECF subfamily)
MNEDAAVADQAHLLLGLYDRAMSDVYGYLLRRCQGASVTEDLTAETFLAAVSAVKR